VSWLTKLASEFNNRAHILVIYISEAHACDEWPLGSFTCIKQHKTISQRLNAANEFVKKSGFTLPIYADDITNEFDKTYSSWPERYVIIDTCGKLAAISNATSDFGYDRAALHNDLLAACKK